MQNIEKNTFEGIDSDSDVRIVGLSSYISAQNVRLVPNVSNTTAYLQSVATNTSFEISDYPNVDGVCVGKCKDYQYGFVYFFYVGNGFGNDRIVKIDANTDVITTLLVTELFPNYKDSSHNIKTNINPFVSATIYDNQLFWVDGTDETYCHQPRFLDINIIADIVTGIGQATTSDSTSKAVNDLLSVSMVAPIYPLTCTVVTNTDDNFNYLNNKSYQFTYRYIYNNGATSRFAPISHLAVTGYDNKLSFPQRIDLLYGDKIQYLNVGTTLNVLSTTVKYIEFSFRANYLDDFKSFKKIQYPTVIPSGTEVLSFFGNEAYNIVAQNDYITEFDNVPLLAESVQYADTRTFYGRYKQERYKLPVWSTGGEQISYLAPVNSQVLKPGSKYLYAIDFIDHFGKRTSSYVSGNVYSNDVDININGSITTASQDGLLSTVNAQEITLNLNDIPSDIEAIQVRRSENLTVDRFIQGRIEHAYYQTGNDINGNPTFINGPDWTTTNYTNYDYLTNKNTTTGGARNILFDISNWSRSGINYTFNIGDRLRLLTADQSDTLITHRGADYTIQSQTGDILSVNIEDKLNSNCIVSLRDGSNNPVDNPNTAIVGDGGGIWFSYQSSLNTTKVSSDTCSNWKDSYNLINFYGCSQWIGTSGEIDNNIFFVVGEGGIILQVNCYVDGSGNITFDINELRAYNTSNPTLNSIFAGLSWTGIIFIGAVGALDNNGNGTILIHENNYGVAYNFVDKSSIYAMKCNCTKISAATQNSDYQIQNLDNSFKSFYICGDSNSYIICGKLNTDITLNQFVNVGTLNTAAWEPGGDTTQITNLAGRSIVSIAAIGVYDSFIPVTSSLGGIIIVGESGLYGKIDCNDSSALTFSVIILPIDSSFESYTWNDVAVDRFAIQTANDRPYAMVVGSGGTVVTVAENEFYAVNLNVVRMFNIGNSIDLLSCTYAFRLSDDHRYFSYCGENYFAGRNGKIEFSDNVFQTFTTNNNIPIINYGAMIEVYTPSVQSTTQLYYEIGYVKQLSAGNSTLNLVLGNGNNQAVSGYENVGDGDCFSITKQYYGRLWSKRADKVVSMTPDGKTEFAWNQDIGRPSVEDLTVNFVTYGVTAELTEPFKLFDTNISFSNQYIQGTQINDLRSFELLNYKQLPIEYGAICALKVANNTNEDGTVMLSIHKRETVSIYLGKVQFTDVAGTNTISLSDDILGSYRTVNGSLGSVHPESICEYNSKVYGFDALKGVVWRYAQDGMARISDNGMRKYFYAQNTHINDKSKTIYDKVVSEYNPFYDEVIFSFTTTSNRTGIGMYSAIWNERLNRWIGGRVNFSPYNPSDGLGCEFMPVMQFASMYQSMYSTYEKFDTTYRIGIDKHDTNSGYLYGQTIAYWSDNTSSHVPTVTFIANQSIDTVKSWLNIRLQTGELWDAYVSDENANTTNMVNEQSFINNTQGDWRKLENNYYTPIMRADNKYTGDPMKSQTLTIQLVLNYNNLYLNNPYNYNKIVNIYDATVKYALSFR